jgi:hypothetical protein
MTQLSRVGRVWLVVAVVAMVGACGSDANDSCGGASGASGQGGAAGQGGVGGASGQSGSGGAAGQAGVGGASGQGGVGGDGTTVCGAGQCEAGQHCFNGICINGCLTDNNCNSNQSCQDINPNTSVGTCRNRPMMATKDCDAFCMKAFACQDPEAIFCMDQCIGLSAECVTCVVASNCGAGCESMCAF